MTDVQEAERHDPEQIGRLLDRAMEIAERSHPHLLLLGRASLRRRLAAMAFEELRAGAEIRPQP